MNVALSDLVTCPHCGPTYGLILLPYEVRDRRVVSGVLGCANCRERYPVEGGVADLRPPGGVTPAAEAQAEAEAQEAQAPEAAEAAAVRLAALLDLAEGAGTVLLVGHSPVQAARVAALVDEVEVVVAEPAGDGAPGGGSSGVSRIRLEGGIPFRSGGLRGVALTGPAAALLEEGARAVGPGGRLVVDDAPSDARSRVEAAGLRVLVEEEGAVVAAR